MAAKREPCVATLKCHSELNPRDIKVSSISSVVLSVSRQAKANTWALGASFYLSVSIVIPCLSVRKCDTKVDKVWHYGTPTGALFKPRMVYVKKKSWVEKIKMFSYHYSKQKCLYHRKASEHYFRQALGESRNYVIQDMSKNIMLYMLFPTK